MTAGTAERTVVLQGTTGSYSSHALNLLFSTQTYFKNTNYTPVHVSTFDQVFENVDNGSADFGLVPIENSTTGTNLLTFDLLNQHHLYIVGEICSHETHCLLAIPGTKIENLREIRSQSLAIDQCRKFISNLPNEISINQSADTATSAQQIAENKMNGVAAIASEDAAELYGLQVLKKGIEDSPNTITRYLLLAKKPIAPERHLEPKTSISVVMKNKIGAFHKVLSCFALRDIQIIKIESRPSSRSITLSKPWEYILYLDFDGGVKEEKVKNAIKNVEEFSVSVRVLGSYPRFESIGNEYDEFNKVGMMSM